MKNNKNSKILIIVAVTIGIFFSVCACIIILFGSAVLPLLSKPTSTDCYNDFKPKFKDYDFEVLECVTPSEVKTYLLVKNKSLEKDKLIVIVGNSNIQSNSDKSIPDEIINLKEVSANLDFNVFEMTTSEGNKSFNTDCIGIYEDLDYIGGTPPRSQVGDLFPQPSDAYMCKDFNFENALLQ